MYQKLENRSFIPWRFLFIVWRSEAFASHDKRGNVLIMNKLFILVTVLLTIVAGCAADATTSEPSIHGNWMYVNSAGTAGVGATLNEDGTYVVTLLRLTSPTTAQASVEAGTYTSTAKTMTFTATHSTCPNEPATHYATYNYTLSNDRLSVLFPEGIIAFERNPHEAESSFVITFGCFQSGKFVASSLVPVK